MSSHSYYLLININYVSHFHGAGTQKLEFSEAP